MESAITHSVEVQVTSYYIAEQSEPQQEKYVFAYRIRLRNLRDDTVELRQRSWLIDNGCSSYTVKGDGVIGQFPVLRQGDVFTYTSWTQLDTPVGTMEGQYIFVDENGENFSVTIPKFLLSAPHSLA